MYNDTIKNKYIETSDYEESTKKFLSVAFNASDPVERRLEKDLCEFSPDNVKELLKKISTTNKTYLKALSSVYSYYCRWCYQYGYTSLITNWFDNDYVNDIINEIIPYENYEDSFFGYEEIMSYVENIYDPSNKFIAYAIWSGIKGNKFTELVNLKFTDINQEEKKVYLSNGRVAEVDDMFIELAKAANLSSSYRPNAEKRDTAIQMYVPSEYIIKQCSKNNDYSHVTDVYITFRMMVIKEQSRNKFVSASTLYRNGLFYFVKKKYESIGVNIKDAISLKMEKSNKYKYEQQTQDFIYMFGSSMTARTFRRDFSEHLGL